MARAKAKRETTKQQTKQELQASIADMESTVHRFKLKHTPINELPIVQDAKKALTAVIFKITQSRQQKIIENTKQSHFH
jgi:hypothetical protein